MDVSGNMFSVFRMSSDPQAGIRPLDILSIGEEPTKSKATSSSVTVTATGDLQADAYATAAAPSGGGGLVGRRKKLLEAGRREVDSAASTVSREKNDAILRQEISGDSLLRIMTENQASVNNKVITMSENGDLQGLQAFIDLGSHFKWDACRGLNNYTPLHHACSRGHLHVTASILTAAPTILHSMTSSDETSLHLAVTQTNGQPEGINLLLIALLIDKGADVDAQTKDGETPLMYAARKGAGAAVRLLLGRGAKVAVEDKYGDTAADYADGHAGTTRWLDLHLLENQLMALSMSPSQYRPHTEGEELRLKVRVHTGGHSLAVREVRGVLSFLNAADLASAACVCPLWHAAAEGEELWEHLGSRRWKQCLLRSAAAAGREGGRGLSGGAMRPKSK
jgi:hypothetical protein